MGGGSGVVEVVNTIHCADNTFGSSLCLTKGITLGLNILTTNSEASEGTTIEMRRFDVAHIE